MFTLNYCLDEPLSFFIQVPFLKVVDDGDVENLLVVHEPMLLRHPLSDCFAIFGIVAVHPAGFCQEALVVATKRLQECGVFVQLGLLLDCLRRLDCNEQAVVHQVEVLQKLYILAHAEHKSTHFKPV